MDLLLEQLESELVFRCTGNNFIIGSDNRKGVRFAPGSRNNIVYGSFVDISGNSNIVAGNHLNVQGHSNHIHRQRGSDTERIFGAGVTRGGCPEFFEALRSTCLPHWDTEAAERETIENHWSTPCSWSHTTTFVTWGGDRTSTTRQVDSVLRFTLQRRRQSAIASSEIVPEAGHEPVKPHLLRKSTKRTKEEAKLKQWKEKAKKKQKTQLAPTPSSSSSSSSSSASIDEGTVAHIKISFAVRKTRPAVSPTTEMWWTKHAQEKETMSSPLLSQGDDSLYSSDFLSD